MELIGGYAWILSAVLIVGWILSGWARRRIPWAALFVLCVALISSLAYIFYGADGYGRPMSESQLHCPHVVECLNLHPVGFWANGMLGLVCSLVSILLTGAVELVIACRKHASAE